MPSFNNPITAEGWSMKKAREVVETDRGQAIQPGGAASSACTDHAT